MGNYDESYTEALLNGTDPIIKDNLIPITILNDGTVKKADTTKEWYSYEKKTWANAIILEDETKTYEKNEIIPESNIESYFVWIPRYKYQIFDNGLYSGLTTEPYVEKSQEIKIVFENKSTKISTGTKKGDWLTHSAFTSFESNGMWVGKFETGYKGATTTLEAQKNTVDTNKIQVKPNVYSWREIQVSNAHLNSYNYQRDLDSHMSKNTEWGSVAYLSHSKYGANASVRVNNNMAYITGYSAINEPTCGNTGVSEDCNRYEETLLNTDGIYTKRYNTTTGYIASTTGNISGIYDMAGGSWDYVMGVMASQNGIPFSGVNNIYNSGFNGPFSCVSCITGNTDILELTNGVDFPDNKYYDVYAYSGVETDFQRRILGDATGEMGPFRKIVYGLNEIVSTSWNYDYSLFIFNGNPWFDRGSGNKKGREAGIFNYGYAHGYMDGVSSYRIVLTPGGNA